MSKAMLLLALSLAAHGGASSEIAKVPVQTFELPNGMKFLAVVRPELSTVSAGWVARVGSANERPGITGMSHFFEHMMFKGSRTLGTTNLERDLQIVEEQERLQEEIRAIYREQRERYRLGEIEDPFVVGKWEEIAPGDAEGRARLSELFGGEVTHLPLRDPLTLKALP